MKTAKQIAKQIAKEQLHNPEQWTQKECEEMDERERDSEVYGDEFILPTD